MGDLAYRRLMDWYYLHEKPVPENVEKAAEEIGMLDEIQDVERVLKRYFDLEIGVGWRSKRCDEEIQRTNHISETARENGAKGGRRKGSKDTKPRAKRGTKTQGLAGAKQSLGNNEPMAKPQASEGLATRNPVPGTNDPIHSAPVGAGTKVPDDDPGLLIPPDRFPPPDAPFDGQFDLDARNRMIDAAADDLDPAELERLRTGVPPPLDDEPLSATFIRPRGPFEDLKAEAFGVGVPLLRHFGMPDKDARSMVAKWFFKARAQDIVVDAINSAIRNRAEDPRTYIAKIVSEADKGRGQKIYPGSLKGMNYGTPKGFIEGFPEANLDMSEWDDK